MRNQQRTAERTPRSGPSLYIVPSGPRAVESPPAPEQAPGSLHASRPSGSEVVLGEPIELEPASGMLLGLTISVGFWALAAVLMAWRF